MTMLEIVAIILVAIVAIKITNLWDINNKAEKEAARKLMSNGIYGHFENGKFVFDTSRQ